ncbi:MAG TPA: phosphoglucosamine mutase, partial [Desulfobacterales bacterium]|nr:phosphoglucosamine mutase [Desulfobacterales bacterium]
MAESERTLFGTDGIRGVANRHPMTPEIVLRVGRAVASLFRNSKRRHRILIGRDTRLSGPMIEDALVAGICSIGVDALTVGVLPTPAVAFLTMDMKADAAIMISASHNPFEDNGIKIFQGNGLKLPDAAEARIEAMMASERLGDSAPSGAAIGRSKAIFGADGRYAVFLKNAFPKALSLEGLKIVVDCAHGAGHRIAPLVLEEMGAEVIPMGNDPDGRNINLKCGAMHPEIVAAAVRKHRAHAGIALDGDADRVIFSDEKGKVMDGDHLMAICALEMKARKELRKNTVVATVMSNMGFEIAMKEAGIKLIRTQVGDRYILEHMLNKGYNLGGEQSGHLIFLDHTTTGDGILSALQVLAVMKKKGRPLSELAAVMTTLPQVLVNVTVEKRMDLDSVPVIGQAIAEAEKKLAGTGRVLVRFSGTQALCRVMIEGPSQKEITSMANEL